VSNEDRITKFMTIAIERAVAGDDEGEQVAAAIDCIVDQGDMYEFVCLLADLAAKRTAFIENNTVETYISAIADCFSNARQFGSRDAIDLKALARGLWAALYIE